MLEIHNTWLAALVDPEEKYYALSVSYGMVCTQIVASACVCACVRARLLVCALVCMHVSHLAQPLVQSQSV